MTAIEKLTELQKRVGYEPMRGFEVNPIALLGLLGEAGEVMNEAAVFLDSENPSHNLMLDVSKTAAKGIDLLKKEIRDKKLKAHVLIQNAQAFDIEVADLLYYLNAIAINRGKTLADYAEISYKKVSAKTQIDIK